MRQEYETVPCELCGVPTRMVGTKRCDRCWEVERVVLANRELAAKILNREVLGRIHGMFEAKARGRSQT